VASVREAPNTIAYNKCETAADCDGGICSEDKQCRSRSTAFDKILFEVTPPADGSAIAGVQYLLEKDGLAERDVEVPLGLKPIAQVTGKVTATKRKCPLNFVNEENKPVVSPGDKSMPARVSLIPSTTTYGLYSPNVGVQSKLVDAVYWGFTLSIPPGTYDIYVEPGQQPDDSNCVVPPQLLRENKIEPGNLTFDLPEPSTFTLDVPWPKGDGALDGWTVDMLEPVSGRVISNRVVLSRNGTKGYRAALVYSSVIVGRTAISPQPDQLLRLSPPGSTPDNPITVPRPTVLMARSALAVFDADSGTLSNFNSLPDPVHVHGQVRSGSTPRPQAATVTLVAKTLAGIAPGVLASFVRTVTAGEDGQFDVDLLPGEYSVSTVPLASLDQTALDQTSSSQRDGGAVEPLAADFRTWTVASWPPEQDGKTIELGPALTALGHVEASNGPVATAQVQAIASQQAIRYDALQNTLDATTASRVQAAFVPRASSGSVSDSGDFDLKTDPGTFDITVRPNIDTGFAWLVMPNVSITDPSGIGLGPLTMPLPVPYRGTVTVPGIDAPNPVPSALIRAYIYLKGSDYTGDSSKADSVLQIAETRANSDGAFTILVPAELNRPPETLQK